MSVASGLYIRTLQSQTELIAICAGRGIISHKMRLNSWLAVAVAIVLISLNYLFFAAAICLVPLDETRPILQLFFSCVFPSLSLRKTF